MVAHEIRRFILVPGVVHAKPYSSGAVALVFICSITGAVAPSYEVDWNVEGWISCLGSLPSCIYAGEVGL